jgi:hypothetical protein
MGVSVSNITGKRRSTILVEIAETGTDVPHRMTRKPATVIWVPYGTAITNFGYLVYDYANSTSTMMRFRHSGSGNKQFLITPVDGPAPATVTGTAV